MRHLVLLFIAIMFMVSCEQEDTISPELVNGSYVGTFNRSSPNGKYAQAKVTLTLNNGEFTGISDIRNYPAICKGTYKISGQTIEFSNACIFTADFDWTYILDKDFKIEQNGNEIKLVRDYGNQTYDTYRLTKQ